MRLRLKREESLIISKELEPLWYGYISDVDFTGTSHKTKTIDLIKDTNKIRFVFQGYSDSYIRATSGDNWNVLSFRPYYMEQKSSSAAAVELNTMRLMEDRPTRFVVTEKSTGKKVFNINLTDFLALTSMEGNNMDVQEYLDRTV